MRDERVLRSKPTIKGEAARGLTTTTLTMAQHCYYCKESFDPPKPEGLTGLTCLYHYGTYPERAAGPTGCKSAKWTCCGQPNPQDRGCQWRYGHKTKVDYFKWKASPDFPCLAARHNPPEENIIEITECNAQHNQKE